jgi:hypothetical protein
VSNPLAGRVRRGAGFDPLPIQIRRPVALTRHGTVAPPNEAPLLMPLSVDVEEGLIYTDESRPYSYDFIQNMALDFGRFHVVDRPQLSVTIEPSPPFLYPRLEVPMRLKAVHPGSRALSGLRPPGRAASDSSSADLAPRSTGRATPRGSRRIADS